MNANNSHSPMENLLEGLDESSGVLTTEELRLELSARGIDADAVTDKIQSIIAKHMDANNCELIEDEHGWWMQSETPNGGKHCYHMDATDEIEAEHEAMQEGFTNIRICRQGKPVIEVTIPKSDGP